MLQFLRESRFFIGELYFGFTVAVFGIQSLTSELLIQDKICLNLYNQTKSFCQRINEVAATQQKTDIQNQIFSQAASFSNYHNLLNILPLFFWSLFIGSLLDRYGGATKIFLILMNAMNMLVNLYFIVNVQLFWWSPYMILFNTLLSFFTGGMTTFLTASNRYLVMSTRVQYRVIRFTVFSIFMTIGISVGTLIGGYTLRFSHEIESPQLRNYNLNFVISIVMSLVSLIFICFVDVEGHMKLNSKDNDFLDSDYQEIINNNNTEFLDEFSTFQITRDHQAQETFDKPSFLDRIKAFFSVVFDLNNISETFRCFIKKRENNARKQIVIMVIIIAMIFVNVFGVESMFLQFSQKVYQFNAKTYSTVKAISKIFPLFITITASYLLIHRFKLNDFNLGLLGVLSGFISSVVVGSFVHPMAYFASIYFGSLGPLLGVVIKTKISKIVPAEDLGKIFSVTSSLESMTPFLGTLLFSSIFSATVATYPTMIYLMSAFIFFITLILWLYQDSTYDLEEKDSE